LSFAELFEAKIILIILIIKGVPMKKNIHKNVKILVVEDDITNQNLFINLLQKKGWYVCIAGEGKEALRL
jgi:PleD family two-component response regulator